MSNMFPVGNPTLLSTNGAHGVQNPAPIIVGTIPLISISNVVYAPPSPVSNFSVIIAALPAGNTINLIPPSANQRWVAQALVITAIAAGISQLMDNGFFFAPFICVANVPVQPLGQLPYLLVSPNVGSGLDLKNTAAAAMTYHISLFAGYITN